MRTMIIEDKQVLKEALEVVRNRRSILFADIRRKQEEQIYISPILKRESEYVEKLYVALDNMDGFNWQHEKTLY